MRDRTSRSRRVPASRCEARFSRRAALALATLGRFAEAKPLAGNAAQATKAVETRVLVAAIEAICAMRERTADMRDDHRTLGRVRHSMPAAVDLVVTRISRQCRSSRGACSHSAVTRERTIYIACEGGRSELWSRQLASRRQRSTDPVSSLSPREREVYELICDGLSNGEIGTRLFITEGTVKVHVQHVFDKLGVRSRTALAINAAAIADVAPI